MMLVSCVSVEEPAKRKERAERLQRDLMGLAPTVAETDARLLALTAVERSSELGGKFRPMHWAWANNALVNAGMRERGLCYQYRDDLYLSLGPLKLKTLQLHLTSTYRATPREHNGIVVTAIGQPFMDGIVLDAWVHGGRLWWKRVKADKRHKWEPLPWALTPVVLRGLPGLPPKD